MIKKAITLKFTAAILGSVALAGVYTGVAHAATTPVVACTHVVGPAEGVATGVACTSDTPPLYTGSGPVVLGFGTVLVSCAASTGVEVDGLWTIVGNSCT